MSGSAQPPHLALKKIAMKSCDFSESKDAFRVSKAWIPVASPSAINTFGRAHILPFLFGHILRRSTVQRTVVQLSLRSLTFRFFRSPFHLSDNHRLSQSTGLCKSGSFIVTTIDRHHLSTLPLPPYLGVRTTRATQSVSSCDHQHTLRKPARTTRSVSIPPDLTASNDTRQSHPYRSANLLLSLPQPTFSRKRLVCRPHQLCRPTTIYWELTSFPHLFYCIFRSSSRTQRLSLPYIRLLEYRQAPPGPSYFEPIFRKHLRQPAAQPS